MRFAIKNLTSIESGKIYIFACWQRHVNKKIATAKEYLYLYSGNKADLHFFINKCSFFLDDLCLICSVNSVFTPHSDCHHLYHVKFSVDNIVIQLSYTSNRTEKPFHCTVWIDTSTCWWKDYQGGCHNCKSS